MSATKGRHQLAEPFNYVEVSVSPISFVGKPPHGLTVGIMNQRTGQGTWSSIDYAEAEAKAVLKAIRAYRRAHPVPDGFGSTPEGDT